MSIYISLSIAVRTSLAIFNSVACAIFLILRIYHQTGYQTEAALIRWTGFFCMFAGFLCSFSVINVASDSYFGDERWCGLSLKLNTGTYTLHRALLYLFIILRLEVVSKFDFVNPKIITCVKMVIGTTGIFMVVLVAVSTDGFSDENSRCTFIISNAILIPLFFIDVFVCVGGTYMFMRPLKRTLSHIECDSIRHMLEKTKTWSLVCLISTFITMVIIAVTDGFGEMITFDCSITSFSLVMMMSPVRRLERSTQDLTFSKKAKGEVQEITSIFKKNPSGSEMGSDFDRELEKVLNEQETQQSNS